MMSSAKRMRCGLRILPLCMLVLGLLAGCESAVDPRTGEAGMRLNLPGTEANRRNLERQWDECTRFNSASICRRRIGWSPPGGARAVDDDK